VTATVTATAETGYKIIIENSTNESAENLLGGTWYTYNDKGDGGTSRIWPEPGNKFEKSGSGRLGNGRAVIMKGSVTTIFQYGYMGMGTSFDKNSKVKDLTGCAGLRFWYKGDGKTYRVKVVSVHPDFIKGNGDNHFGAEFETTDKWQLFELPFSYFTQEPYWGTKVDQDKAFSAIKDIQWQTKGQPLESVELAIDGVEVYGCSKDN
jgi:hypothetical protein